MTSLISFFDIVGLSSCSGTSSALLASVPETYDTKLPPISDLIGGNEAFRDEPKSLNIEDFLG